MTRKMLKLNCTSCGEFKDYYPDRDRDGNLRSDVVCCADCGKKHSDESVFMVDPRKSYERDEAGVLLEEVY